MQIEIKIPIILVTILEKLSPLLVVGSAWGNGLSTFISESWLSFYVRLRELTVHESPIALPILVILVVFWPVIISFLVVFATTSTWMFWLLTSFVFGIVQMVYVSYHFVMVCLDLVGLSILKTYTVIRSRMLHYLGDTKLNVMKSRRILWKTKLEEAKTYDDYLKIQITSKHDDNHESNTGIGRRFIRRNTTGNSNEPDDSNITNRILRTLSFKDIKEVPSSPTRLTRARSVPYFDDDGKEHQHTTQEQHDHCDPYELNLDPEIVQELGEMTTVMLMTTKMRLKEARQASQQQSQQQQNSHNKSIADNATSSLKALLSGVVKRNHLTIENLLIRNARSVALSGQYGLSSKSRKLVHAHFEEVEKGLEWIAQAPTGSTAVASSTASSILSTKATPSLDIEEDGILSEEPNHYSDNNDSSKPSTIRTISSDYFNHSTEITDRMTLIRKMKQNMGRTALMLSGGGAQAMYHLGSIRALVESNVYGDITVISGTSGGSITAAMCAIKRPDELLKDVCVPWVSTNFMLNGEMKKKEIRWFPRMTDMATYWLKTGLMVESHLFRRTCEFYFSDITFEEAFERTGKHVCITVSASRASGSTAQRLLLNHISTPHITLASAVAASCALPGVMAPAKLQTKNSNSGRLEPFEVDGVEWIDGSVQADLPFQRISTLFNVSNYVVCQTNFHVMPFMNKAHHPTQESIYWRVFQMLEWDIRNRVLQLSRLGLFPKVFGQDVSKVFKQKYHGNLTIVPRFTPAQTFGLRALANPTVEDMKGYLKYGQMAAWPYISVVRDMIRLEKSLDDCLTRLQERFQDLYPDIDYFINHGDDVDSIASSSIQAGNSGIATTSRLRFGGREDYRKKLISVEKENSMLKQQIRQMQQLLKNKNIKSFNINGTTNSDAGNGGRSICIGTTTDHEDKKCDEKLEDKGGKSITDMDTNDGN